MPRNQGISQPSKKGGDKNTARVHKRQKAQSKSAVIAEPPTPPDAVITATSGTNHNTAEVQESSTPTTVTFTKRSEWKAFYKSPSNAHSPARARQVAVKNAYQAKYRTVTACLNAVKGAGSFKAECAVLHSMFYDKLLQKHWKALGIVSKENTKDSTALDNISRLYKSAGRSAPELAFKRSIEMSLVSTPTDSSPTNPLPDNDANPHLQKKLKQPVNYFSNKFGVSVSHAKRTLSKAATRRKLVKMQKSFWNTMKCKKGFTHITPEIKTALHEWIMRHPSVFESPIKNDCVKINVPGEPEPVSVPKLLLACSIRELHNDLAKDPDNGGLAEARKDGKLIIGDSALRYLLPHQLKK